MGMSSRALVRKAPYIFVANLPSQPRREKVAQIGSHKAGSLRYGLNLLQLHSILFEEPFITNIMDRRQRYSHYLPMYQNLSRTTSRAASFSKDGTRSPKGKQNGRPSSSVQSTKRRSTMNSRDAAYDEEEELRRVLEISKEDKTSETIDTGTRRGKRGRSDSEE